MHNKIVEFLSKQTCCSLCYVDASGSPWCFSFSILLTEMITYYTISRQVAQNIL